MSAASRVGRRSAVGASSAAPFGGRVGRLVRGRIGRLVRSRTDGREPGRVAQGRHVPDAGPREREQHRVTGRVVAGLGDQLDTGASRRGRDSDRGREPVRLGFLDGSAQPKAPDDDDHPRSVACGGVRGRSGG